MVVFLIVLSILGIRIVATDALHAWNVKSVHTRCHLKEGICFVTSSALGALLGHIPNKLWTPVAARIRARSGERDGRREVVRRSRHVPVRFRFVSRLFDRVSVWLTLQ